MRIAIIGYGKMGKLIAQLAEARGHQIVFKATSSDQAWKQDSSSENWDCAIEFTSPEAVEDNLRSLMNLGVPTVCGSTGWNHLKKEIHNLVNLNQGSFISASNFSVGVNLFFAVNRKLARLMNAHSEYTPEIIEIHHTEKKDAPSGTAITTAEAIIDEIHRIQEWQLKSEHRRDATLSIDAKREPQVPGTHIVRYEGEIDEIELKHEAKNRNGFALGAILAAEFIHNKKGIFSIEDVLGIEQD